MPLASVVSDLTRKKAEAEILLSEIQKKEKGVGNALLCTVLKSSIVLVLYNTVESTMYSVLEILHEKCQAKHFNELSDCQKEIFALMHFGKNGSKRYKENIELTISGELKFPSFESYSDGEKIFSGNLDARRINKILAVYGVRYSVDKAYGRSFLEVKTLRNKLAHGECSFSMACRNKLVTDIESMSGHIFTGLNNIVMHLNGHIRAMA
ncbi:MAE_28990/MAE_18760 family HEPN-like nuclease [Desulfovibrio sp. TomC]|uniref:MAE_28990/MAE_18760 family HEPN-like nuclease n=1 Tax=Desulfovibrio sp. TomC TaxID=1562888 RepID=UPI0012E27596|nr:MAE_28990/MAE_18760 family HEPN-like nuclease [Desulfovibrio sp. TomC]